MTDHIEDGGPAFPVADPGWLEPRTTTESKRAAAGMTLRDYFAAQFMARAQSLVEYDGGWDMDNAAHGAYKMADAMLKARKS